MEKNIIESILKLDHVPPFELISVRQYAYENGITKPGAIKQIEENRLPDGYEARKVDTTWIIIKFQKEI